MMRLVFRNKLPIFSDLAGPYKVEYGSTTHVCKVGFQRQCQQVRQGRPPSQCEDEFWYCSRVWQRPPIECKNHRVLHLLIPCGTQTLGRHTGVGGARLVWRLSWSVVISVQGIGLLLHINISKVTIRRVTSSEVDFCNWTTILLWLRSLKKTKGTREIYSSAATQAGCQLPPHNYPTFK